jgi:hypothetical protein
VPQDSGVIGVAGVIQLAIAPVFLLTAIATLLGVMTNRLARVIDRARLVESQMPQDGSKAPPQVMDQLNTLRRRAKHINRAITLCTATAVLVCTVIVFLFLGAFLEFDSSRPVALLFILAMLSFLAGLLSLLKEIFIATRTLRFRTH